MNEKIMDKIKKLMKLGKETNFQGEAEQALAAAMRLATRIGVKLADIETDDEETAQDTGIGAYLIWKEKSRLERWEKYLGSAIAGALGCKVVVQIAVGEQLKIIGTKQDAEIMDGLYIILISQLRKLWRQAKKDLGYKIACYGEHVVKLSWYTGAVSRIEERAKEMFSEEEKQQYALVIADKALKVREYADGMHLTRSRARRFSTLQGVRADGYEAGNRVSFSSGRIAG
jgi:hypothetical protein